MRKLASVQRVLNVEPIQDADSIEHIQVLGWHLVAMKNEFKVGDLCVYIETDSILPESNPKFEFMRNKNFRIKTVRLRGQISQGIAFPLSILPESNAPYEEDQDVTELLGIIKYEPPIPECLEGVMRGDFPQFIRKTDEDRVQICGKLLHANKGKVFYATEKLDGSSTTFYINKDDFGVCTRRMNLKQQKDNARWKIAEKYNIENSLRRFGQNLALQGELIGPGIQGNKYGLKEVDIRFFSIYNIDTQKYIPYVLMKSILNKMGLPMVPLISDNYVLTTDIDAIVAYSIGESRLAKTKREGLVLRSIEDSNISFKAINPEFLLKHGE